MRRDFALTLATLALAGGGCSPLFYAALKIREAGYPRRELALGAAAAGNTEEPDRRFHPSCAGRNEVDPGADTDQVWHFVPPATGRYRFRAAGAHDTVLAVYSRGDELGCNDDGPAATDAELTLPLRAHEDYLVVVDGYRGDRGRYALSAEVAPEAPSPLREPVEDLGNTARRCRSPGRLSLGLATGLFLAESGTLAACGGRGVGTVYQLDVEHAGLLRVTEVSPFPAVLALRRVCNEGHTAMACAAHGEGTRYAVLTAPVEPGTYYLVLDAAADDARGPFALDVQVEDPSPPGVSGALDRPSPESPLASPANVR